MVHDKNHVGLWMSPGKHGRQIREKYFRAGKPCPVLISFGHDPLLFLAGGNELKYGLSEYDYAGGHRGEPFEIVKSELHGLPMPAHAEIVLEGEMVEADKRDGRSVRRVHRLLRLEPERAAGRARQARLLPQQPDPHHRVADASAVGLLLRKCVIEIRHDLGRGRARRLSGVQGVWCHQFGGARMFNVIVDQAGLSRPCAPGRPARGRLPVGILSRPLRRRGRRGHRSDRPVRRDVGHVHALRSREDIEFIRRAWSGAARSLLQASSTNSRAIIDACRPFERLKEFPMVARASAELRQKVQEKFADLLGKIGCA